MNRYITRKKFSTNPFQSKSMKSLKLGSQTYNYYDVNTLGSDISTYAL